jgi:hypothetical protein
MPAQQEPLMGLYHGYSSGESGWGNQVSANFVKIGAFMQISVLDRNLTTPPVSPADGDCYIPAATATGVWATREGQITVYRASSSAWEFYVPKVGWLAYIQDEEVLSAYKAGGWSAGIAI